MMTLLKITASIAVVLLATHIAKKEPSASGLIAVMPLASLLILLFIYLENKGNPLVMAEFTKGALWGMLPTAAFFVVAFFCFQKGFSLLPTLLASFAVWALAAVLHQRFI
ncbi:MAG: DUF3147 family protein [Deltaproteobacteria bacterium]|nr:DUF3147 family protein [Deltaproteobacteria bacterium]